MALLKGQINKIIAERKRLKDQIRLHYSAKMIKGWDDVRNKGIIIPEPPPELNYVNLTTVLINWVNNTEKELSALDAPQKVEKVTIGDTKGRVYGKVVLFPEQQALVDRVMEDYDKGQRSFYSQDGTGSGKTFAAGGIIFEAIKRGLGKNPFKLINIAIFTKKPVRMQFRDVLRDMGLLSQCHVMTYSDLNQGTSSKTFYSINFNKYTGEETIKWHPNMVPDILILDEAHSVMNDDSLITKVIRAMYESNQDVLSLYMSATPFVKVNDSGTYVISLKRRWPELGVSQVVDSRESFKSFARIVGNGDPGCKSVANMERLSNALKPYMYKMPYVKWPAWGVNVSRLCKFTNERDRKKYDIAFDKYKEAMRKVGRNTEFGSLEFWVALTQFRKTAEPLRVDEYVEQIEHNMRHNTATIVATAFKPTIVAAAFKLIDNKILTRDQISVIWGGVKKFHPQRILTQEQLEDLSKRLEEWTDEDRKNVEETIRYMEDQEFNDESKEEQEYRHRRLEEMGIFRGQSAFQRQMEVDRFQDGTHKVCLMTLASGGVGLSLDRNKEFLWPRHTLVSPVYNGREAAQAVGRDVRRATLPGAVYHEFCYLEGTYEETHVMPIMENSFGCLSKFTGRNVSIVVDPNAPPPARKKRTKEDAELEAQNDESQVRGISPVDDEEDEESEE